MLNYALRRLMMLPIVLFALSLMIFALLLVPVFAIVGAGGPGSAMALIEQVDPSRLQWIGAGGVIAIVSAADLSQAGYDGSLLRPDDAILVDGSAEESLPALDKLLATFPSYRTIGFLDAVRSAEWGIVQAVRQGS